MARALLAALVAATTTAAAQTAPASPPPQQPASDAPAADKGQQDVDQKIEAAKKELRDEIRAQMATQAAAQGWEEEWADQTRKLELLELDGYLRVRPDLFHKFDLNRTNDPSNFPLFPRPNPGERTIAGVNMRMRVEPTINVSEEVRIKLQVDALDNLVFGSSPAYATRSDRFDFGVTSRSQVPPSALGLLQDSIAVKRAYGEVSTPIGLLRFGRMGSHWGLGMLHNDGSGNCLDCDYGDTVDRLQFVTEPLTGWYFTPMLDFDVEGPFSPPDATQGQPFDLSNRDDAHSYVLAIARRDTPQQERAKMDNGIPILNAGVHYMYRVQRFDPVAWAANPTDPNATRRETRNAAVHVPDLWAKFERKEFRLELEAAAVLGTLEVVIDPEGARLQETLTLLQFGAVAQGE
ncbi:MAG TPA: TIGR04551 family protein, partial [Myxococcaceae bacterium]|nr:TIGR04551 family protein [Myxococcaceae bacterium]